MKKKRKLYKTICPICNRLFFAREKNLKACYDETCQRIKNQLAINKRLPRSVKKLLETSREIYLELFESEIEIKDQISNTLNEE